MTDQSSKPRHAKASDCVSNGSRLHARGASDGRTKAARRWRDLFEAFAKDCGELSESDRALVRACATLAQKNEQLQADMASGAPVDADALCRTSTALLTAIERLPRHGR